MTPEERARELVERYWSVPYRDPLVADLEETIRAAVAEERAECARIAEDEKLWSASCSDGDCAHGMSIMPCIADAIRARQQMNKKRREVESFIVESIMGKPVMVYGMNIAEPIGRRVTLVFTDGTKKRLGRIESARGNYSRKTPSSLTSITFIKPNGSSHLVRPRKIVFRASDFRVRQQMADPRRAFKYFDVEYDGRLVIPRGERPWMRVTVVYTDGHVEPLGKIIKYFHNRGRKNPDHFTSMTFISEDGQKFVVHGPDGVITRSRSIRDSATIRP